MQLTIMKLTTITIDANIKKELEKYKGNKNWNEFFKEIIKILEELKKKEKIKLAKELEEISFPDVEYNEIKLRLR